MKIHSPLRALPSSSVGGADITELDVGVSDRSAGGRGFDILWLSRRGGASSTSNTWLAGVGIGGVVAVKPEHAGGVVVPNTEGQNHTDVHCLGDTSQTAMWSEAVTIAEGSLGSAAVGGGDGVVGGHAGDVDLGVLDNLAVLDVETTDLGERAAGRVVVGEELSDDGELGVGVDGLSGAVETLVAHTVRVEVTTVGVANASVSVVCTTASCAAAAGGRSAVTRMGGVGSRNGVGLPDIHLVTAGTVVSGTSVGIVCRSLPSIRVGL